MEILGVFWWGIVLLLVGWIITSDASDAVWELLLTLFALAIMAFFGVRIVNAWLAIAG